MELRPPAPLARGRHTAEHTRNQAIAHAIAVGGLAGVFVYQGLVPKVWKLDGGEVAIWQGLGLPQDRAARVVRAVGAAEAAFAVATVALSNKRWPFVIALAAMPTLAIGAAKADRSILTKAFNPASLGLAVASLAGAALATKDGRPNGLRPLRRAPDRQPDVEGLP